MSECKKLMEAIKKAHIISIDFRKSMKHEEDLKVAFNISFRLSQLLNEIGINFRIKEIL